MLSLSLDLAAEETFAATAFASSPQMDESEKQKLRDLVGVQSLNLPDNLPRRLGLTYALVRSQQKNFEDFKVAAAKKQVLKKHLLPQFKEPVYPPELDEYRVFCKAVEKRISTTPKENPRVLDDYEQFVRPGWKFALGANHFHLNKQKVSRNVYFAEIQYSEPNSVWF